MPGKRAIGGGRATDAVAQRAGGAGHRYSAQPGRRTRTIAPISSKAAACSTCPPAWNATWVLAAASAARLGRPASRPATPVMPRWRAMPAVRVAQSRLHHAVRDGQRAANAGRCAPRAVYRAAARMAGSSGSRRDVPRADDTEIRVADPCQRRAQRFYGRPPRLPTAGNEHRIGARVLMCVCVSAILAGLAPNHNRRDLAPPTASARRVPGPSTAPALSAGGLAEHLPGRLKRLGTRQPGGTGRTIASDCEERADIIPASHDALGATRAELKRLGRLHSPVGFSQPADRATWLPHRPSRWAAR